jgi:hypothetical protein
MTRCSICHTRVQPTEPTEVCPECEQAYHATCWGEVGGCATYGCSKAPVTEKPPPPAQVGTGWGDEKTCPACQKTIASSVLVCRCGAKFPYADPMTRETWRTWNESQQAAHRGRRTLFLLFLFSLFGLPAPLLGPIAGAYAWRRRRLLAGADGTYLAMGYGAAALGATHLVAILCLAVGL